ncbi:N-methyl-L-tryptophan oxidase [Leifsonia sp. F6_8S_P_1B]|uniref:N-methyl-L-tryptophan oxidase n=1 Tax=Leifsonia williamsii TaxID=3035919 RepID=A0ABT8K7V5_9MICO|nr:N-methyl-L-tryptophan oxidase [Leifsonia williamsii]MDN4613533.1 N-methyl-L-tryptophan oxidase [Leifsonia williamsii]
MNYEVVVVGLGAAGSGALWALARRGVRVAGIEQYGIGHGNGSSHGRSRLFRGGASEGAAYVDLAARSLEIWRDLEQTSGREIVTLVGGVTIAEPESELFRDTVAALRSRDLPHELFDADGLRARYPQHRVRDTDAGVLDPATGVVRPELAITTAVEAAQAAGAEVLTGRRVVAIEEEGDHQRVVLDDGTSVVAGRVIVAAGAWNTSVLAEAPREFTVRRAVLSWFLPKPGHEADFLPNRFPVFTREDETLRGWGAPTIDEFGVKVGLHDQDGYTIDDPYANRPEVEAWEVERVQQFVARQFPDLVPVATNTRGCMITLTPDEDFSIGELDSRPGVVLLAACSGHGFKHSAAVGELGAQLALGEEASLDLAMFDPHRFRTTTGTTLTR